MKRKIAVAAGDGIGPEIMNACLQVMNHLQVPLDFVPVDMGKQWYDQGFSSGMTPEAKAAVESIGILWKGPMETPKGKGVKSINVTARKTWSTYANKRIFKALPGVDTVFSKGGIPVHLCIVRENIEDTYGGIEHMLTADVALCRRFITRPGSLQVHRYAFEMARRNGWKKVTCGHKANIMKITDGLFLETFYEVAKEYPDLEANDLIVDDLAMKLVSRPDIFEVVVLPNLQGDIISDLCAGLVGGLGFAPSANIGDHIAIFEAVHGTAPDITGKNIANPTSLLLSGAMMLRHVGLHNYADAIDAGLGATLTQGVHTADFGDKSKPSVSTSEFIAAIIKNLPAVQPQEPLPLITDVLETQRMMVDAQPEKSEIRGADFFVESELLPEGVAQIFKNSIPEYFQITTMSNRGTQVWPTGSVYTDCINQYRVRVEAQEGYEVRSSEILMLGLKLQALLKLCSIEWLMAYDGVIGYSKAQGQ